MLVPPTVAVSVTVVAVVPKLITPVPAALIVPAMLLLLGAVAVKPPVKVSTSAAASPSCRVPVLVAVKALVMAVPLPSSFRL